MKSELRELIIWLQASTTSWLLLFWNTWISGSLFLMLFCSLMSTVEAYWVWPIFCKVSLQGIFLWFCCLPVFEPCELIWTWAPKECLFFLRLAAHGRCWTADWLAKKGLPHLSHCPLCDQEEETIFQVGVASSPASWTLPFPSGRICGAQWLLLED